MTTQKQQAAEASFKPSSKALSGQKLNIIAYIDTYGSITPADAWNELNCTKLATRIGEIERRCGIEFKKQMEDNGSSRYMRYSFADGYGVFDYVGIKIQ